MRDYIKELKLMEEKLFNIITVDVHNRERVRNLLRDAFELGQTAVTEITVYNNNMYGD